MLTKNLIDDTLLSFSSLLISISLTRLLSSSSLASPFWCIFLSWIICNRGLIWSPSPLTAIVAFRLGSTSLSPGSLVIASVLYAVSFLLGMQEVIWKSISKSMLATSHVAWTVSVLQIIFASEFLPNGKVRTLALTPLLLNLILTYFTRSTRRELLLTAISYAFYALIFLCLFWTEPNKEMTAFGEMNFSNHTFGIGFIIYIASMVESAFYSKTIICADPKSIFLTQSILNFFFALLSFPPFAPLPHFQKKGKSSEVFSTLFAIKLLLIFYLSDSLVTAKSAKCIGVLAVSLKLLRFNLNFDLNQMSDISRSLILLLLLMYLFSGKIILWSSVTVVLQLCSLLAQFSPVCKNSLSFSITEKAYRYEVIDELMLLTPSLFIKKIKSFSADAVVLDFRSLKTKEFEPNAAYLRQAISASVNKQILFELNTQEIFPNKFSKSQTLDRPYSVPLKALLSKFRL